MDKLEQIKETIEESEGLLDKQQEYNFQFDEIIRIISENGQDQIKSCRLNHEDYPGFIYLNPRRYNNGWYPETNLRYYCDRQYRTAVSPIYTNTQTTTSGSYAVVATPRNHEEWCDFVTYDTITF